MGPVLETVIGVSGLLAGVTVPIYVLVRVWQVLERMRLLVLGYRATATVEDYDEFEVGEDRHNYWVTVAFATKTGERRVATLRDASISLPRLKGRMSVVYRPDDPAYAAAPKPVGALLTVLLAPFFLLLAATVTPMFASILFDLDIPPLWWTGSR